MFAILIYQLYRVFSGFFAVFAWAAVFALVFYPTYAALLARVGRPALAAGGMTVLVSFVVLIPMSTFGGIAVTQAQAFYQLIQDKIATGEARTWLELGPNSYLAGLVGRLPPTLRDKIDLPDLGLRGARAAAEYSIAMAGGVARNVAGFVVDFVFMLLVLFFFFRDGRRMVLALRELIPMEAEHKDSVFRHLDDTVSAVVRGMTATAVAQGVLAGGAFAVLDLPFALLLGLASSVASFIPLVGAALIWVPGVVYFFAQGYWARGTILLLWGSLVVSLVDNVVKPLVIGSRVRIPTVFLFFGILGGLQVYGVIGVFLGPALLAIFIAFLRIYSDEYGASSPLLEPTSPPRAARVERRSS